MSENGRGKLFESCSLFFFSMVFTRKGSFFVIFQSQYYFKMVKKKRYRFHSSRYRRWCWEWTASLWELALFGRWCCGFQLQDSEPQITRDRREGTRRGKTALSSNPDSPLGCYLCWTSYFTSLEMNCFISSMKTVLKPPSVLKDSAKIPLMKATYDRMDHTKEHIERT